MAASVVDKVINKSTLSLAALAVFGLAAFGVDVGVGDNQVALGLALLAGGKVVED